MKRSKPFLSISVIAILVVSVLGLGPLAGNSNAQAPEPLQVQEPQGTPLGQRFVYQGFLWSGVGAAIMGGLILAQRSLLWWPIHPVGFIICSVYWTDVLWLTIFLAWAIKLAVTKIGGNKMLRAARIFFLGMILGQFTVASVWAIYDTFTGTINHRIFWV